MLGVYEQLAPVLLSAHPPSPSYLNYMTAILVRISNTLPEICQIVDYRSIPLNSGLYLLQKRLHYIALNHEHQSTEDNENMYHYLCTALSTLLGDFLPQECLTGYSNKTLIVLCIRYLFASLETIYSYSPQQLNKLVALIIQCVKSDSFRITTEKMYKNFIHSITNCCTGLFHYITMIDDDKDLENSLVVLCGCDYIVKTGAHLHCL